VSTSSTIISLLFAVAQFGRATAQQGAQPSLLVQLLVTVGAGAFAIAAVLGLAINWPRSRWQPSSIEIAERLKDWDRGTAAEAAQALALGDVERLTGVEVGNDRLTGILRLAMAVETVGVLLIVAAVATSLVRG
jgi:hypothetical protein